MVTVVLFIVIAVIIGVIIRTQGENILNWGINKATGIEIDSIIGDESSTSKIIEGIGENTDEQQQEQQQEQQEEVKGPSEDDVEGEDIPWLGRYPDSVRSEYSTVKYGKNEQIYLSYLVESDKESIKDYFENKLEKSGWVDVMVMSSEEDISIMANNKTGENQENIVVAIQEAKNYPEYIEIGVVYQIFDNDN